jgi:putative transposase
VQMDHTKVDVTVVDPITRLPVGRPTLTLAIDVATRMAIGFHLSLDPPSLTAVALCLTHRP